MNTIKVVADSMYPYSKLTPIPKGQVEFSKIQFLFSDGWDGKDKIAQFEQDNHLYNRPISDGVCTVPAELDLGPFMLYVKGYDADGMPQIATANGLVLLIVQGAKEGGTPPVPPSPDLYSELLSKMDASLEKAVPIIQDGTWWVWSSVVGDYVDTGICAEGLPGAPGKSAYQQALENGYAGTEEEFGKALSSLRVVSDFELLQTMQEVGLINPICDEAGALFVSDNNTLFIL